MPTLLKLEGLTVESIKHKWAVPKQTRVILCWVEKLSILDIACSKLDLAVCARMISSRGLFVAMVAQIVISLAHQ